MSLLGIVAPLRMYRVYMEPYQRNINSTNSLNIFSFKRSLIRTVGYKVAFISSSDPQQQNRDAYQDGAPGSPGERWGGSLLDYMGFSCIIAPCYHGSP